MNRRQFLAAALASPAMRAHPLSAPRDASSLTLTRLGASTACLAGLPLLDAIREIERLGFPAIEIIAYTGATHSVGRIPGFDYQEASREHRRRVHAATRPFPHISMHLPFEDIRLFSADRRVARSGMDRLKRGLDGLAFLEGELAVAHPGWPDKGRTYRDIWPQMLEVFRELGDYAGARGARIALETMQPDSVQEYADLIFEIDHPAVGAAIDTGHIRGARDIALPRDRRDSLEGRAAFNDVLNRLASTLGRKVIHLHLSDVRSSDWLDHRTIGTGIVDFERLFGTLEQIRYERLLVFELEEPDTLGALMRSRQYVARLVDRE